MGTPTLPSRATQPPALERLQLTVGVADLKESDQPHAVIVTYGLGSCLGVTCFDSAAGVGGMLHAMLPDSKKCERPGAPAAMFLDTGIALLLQNILRLGGSPERCEFKVFGGAAVLQAHDFFNIGVRNIAMMKTLADQHRLRVAVWDTGGQVNRTISLHLATGRVHLRMPSRMEISV